jgi:transcriptional regulator with XRE-family HTH domain
MRSPNQAASVALDKRVTRLAFELGEAVHQERRRRHWSIRILAGKARVAMSTLHGIESGERGSLEMYARLAQALDLTFTCDIGDPTRREGFREDADLVHAAMGELETARLQHAGSRVGIDEPWQHYHYAGRADVIAWDTARSAILHIENRTRFPNVQEAIGSFNKKRTYLVGELWRRLGFERPPRVEVHAIVALWSAEVLHDLRRHPATFRATCPDPPDAFQEWWDGEPPVAHRGTTLLLLDPFATGRQRQLVGLEAALDGSRPRISGYAEAAQRLRQGR